MSGFTESRKESGTPQEIQGAVTDIASLFQGIAQGDFGAFVDAITTAFQSAETPGQEASGLALTDLFGQASVPASTQALAGQDALNRAQAPFQTRAIQEGVRASNETAGGFGTRFGRGASDQASRTVGEVTRGFDLNAAQNFSQNFGSALGFQGTALGAAAGLEGQLTPEQQLASNAMAQILQFLRPGETVVGPSTADRLLGILG